MESNQSTQSKNIGTIIHLSTFSKYIFPFGNFIFPLIFWMCNKKNFFVNEHGKECLNFQISTFLYAICLVFILIFGTLFFGITWSDPEIIRISGDFMSFQNFPELFPFFIFWGIVLLLLTALFIFEIVCVIIAAVRASEGKTYHYPLNIRFIQTEQPKNEPFFKKQTV